MGTGVWHGAAVAYVDNVRRRVTGGGGLTLTGQPGFRPGCDGIVF